MRCRSLVGAISAACILPLLCSSQASAATSIRSHGAQQLRIATIGYKLASESSSLCKTPIAMSGLVLHELGQYPERDRAAVSRAFSIRSGFGVLGIVPGGAGESAGFVVDDEIIALNGKTMSAPRDYRFSKGSYGRISEFTALMETALARGTARITVRRGASIRELVLAGQKGCGGRVHLQNSGPLNAWSDGNYVAVTSAVVNFAASDAEISFVVAHEMAHNLLGHNRGRGRTSLLSMLGLGTARERNEELQADALAARMMLNAGYNGEGAVALLTRIKKKLWWENLSLSHPGFSARIRTVSAVLSDGVTHLPSKGRLTSRMPNG